MLFVNLVYSKANGGIHHIPSFSRLWTYDKYILKWGKVIPNLQMSPLYALICPQ